MELPLCAMELQMPQKHQSTKTNKAVIINTVHFSGILCFSDLVAKNLFGVGSRIKNQVSRKKFIS
jgi:hypothetical protein